MAAAAGRRAAAEGRDGREILVRRDASIVSGSAGWTKKKQRKRRVAGCGVTECSDETTHRRPLSLSSHLQQMSMDVTIAA